MDEALVPPDIPATSDEALTTRVRGLHNAARFTAMAGIAYATLFIISFWLLTDVPRGDATTQEVIDYYQSDAKSTISLVALYLLPFSGLSFLWFIVTLRMWISIRVTRPVSVLFSNIQLASGIVFLTLLLCSAAALSVTAIAIDLGGSDPVAVPVLEFQQFGGSLFFVFSTRMGAMFVFTTTNIGRAHRIFPDWFVVVGLVVGLTMLLTASFNRSLIFVFPMWVLAVCVLILWHARKRTEDILEHGKDGKLPAGWPYVGSRAPKQHATPHQPERAT